MNDNYTVTAENIHDYFSAKGGKDDITSITTVPDATELNHRVKAIIRTEEESVNAMQREAGERAQEAEDAHDASMQPSSVLAGSDHY